MLKIENRTSFGAHEIFQSDPESEREINPKPQSGGDERNVNEEQSDARGAHPEFVGESRRNLEAVFLKEIFESQYEGRVLVFHFIKVQFFKERLYLRR